MSRIGKELAAAEREAGGVDGIRSVLLRHLEQASGRPGSSGIRGRGRILEATVRSERGDGTESLLLMAPYLTLSGSPNRCGMAFVLAAAKQYRTLKFWARDFILLFPGIGAGSRGELLEELESWLSTFHTTSAHTIVTNNVAGRGTAIQAGIAVEFEGTDCGGAFAEPEIHIEGPNGLLPNLDLVNTMVATERHRAGSLRVMPQGSQWHTVWRGAGAVSGYLQSLVHVVSMMSRQAFGYPVFAHGPLLKYRIDSISLSFHQIPQESASESADQNMFELVELTFRSLSNILEHLHQSFFFYLLCDGETFISIANYIAIGILPIVALVGAALTDICRRSQRGQPVFDKLPICTLLALVGVNFLALLAAQRAAEAHRRWITIAALLAPVLLALLGTTRMRISQIRWLCCLWAALAITPLLFLNFGLSVLVGLLYGTLLVIEGQHPLFKMVQMLAMPLTVLALLLVPTGNSYAGSIARNLTGWNWGIPFLLLQPPLLMALCSRGEEEEKLVAVRGTTAAGPSVAVHPKTE